VAIATDAPVPVPGYDSFAGRECGYALEPAPLLVLPASATGQQVDYKIELVSSARDLRRKINVSAEAAFSGFGFDATGRADWAREQAINEFSTYLLLKVIVRNANLRLADFRLNGEAQRLTSEPNWLEPFYRRYGDHFISEYVTGGEFVGLYTFHTRTASEREDLSTKISAAGKMISGSASFGSALSSVDAKTGATLSVLINGGRGKALPQFTPENMLEFVRTFPQMVDPADGFPVRYDSRKLPYDKAIGFPTSVQLPFAENHIVLEELVTEMDRVHACRSVLIRIREHRAAFEAKPAVDETKVGAELDRIEHMINGWVRTVCRDAWKTGDWVQDAGIDLARLRGDISSIAAALPKPKLTRVMKPGTGSYAIQARVGGRVLDVPGARRERGARLHLWDQHNKENQLWRFDKQRDGSYVIRSLLSKDLVLDVSGRAGHDGAELITWDDNGGNNQRWRLEAQDDGSLIIRSEMNGKVLDVEGPNKKSGAKLQLWTEDGRRNQRFFLEDVRGVGR
jgi:hypothetical protein